MPVPPSETFFATATISSLRAVCISVMPFILVPKRAQISHSQVSVYA